MKVRTALPQLLQGAAHLSVWALAAFALDSLLVLRTEEVRAVNGVEQTIVYTQSLLPYIIVSLAAKAVWVYGGALWAFPKYVKKKKTALGTGLVLLLFTGVILLEYWVYAEINVCGGLTDSTLIQISVSGDPTTAGLIQNEILRETPFTFWNMALYVLAFTTAIAWFLVRDWSVQEKQLRELRQLQISTELNFLKLQVNPHFLFNTLNNLFSVAQKNNDEETAAGIAKLAELMRYQLNESSKALIPIEQELRYIGSYIELAKLRFSNDEVEVVFNVRGVVKNRSIPPMLLIPFVENAFKHGVRVGAFSRIVFTLDLTGSQLVFSASNPDHAAANRNNAPHTGIGLENVRKRIALLYPESSELAFTTENGTFNVKLVLPF